MLPAMARSTVLMSGTLSIHGPNLHQTRLRLLRLAYNLLMGQIQDRRIEPSEISPEILKQLDGLVHAGHATLVGADGEKVEIPQALNDLMLYIVDAMQRKQAIFLMPEDEAFTTQAAANFLGMSRPYLLRLLDAGKLPFHRVGTHRRIVFRDLVEFQKTRSSERSRALSNLTKLMDDHDVYDRRLEPTG